MQWLNIELTNNCNSTCSFCRRAEARANDTMEMGFMSATLLSNIVGQFKGSIIQFHRDGEPLLHEGLWGVGQMCRDFTTNIVTNGKLLWDKVHDLVGNFTSVVVSVYGDDPEQFEIVKRFVEYKGDRNPIVIIKFLGDYYNPEYEKLGLKVIRRRIWLGNDYEDTKSPIPEVGVCLDFLYKPSISWDGDVYICNRYDPKGEGLIGNCTIQTLDEIWNSKRRMAWLQLHRQGLRESVLPCKSCEYWGIPAG